MNNLTLILSDIHHNVDQATDIINSVKADKVIFTGDVFDNFYDNPEMVRNTSEWMVDFVSNPNHIMLMGNHEMGYRYPYKSFTCSGHEQWKSFIINDIVSQETWSKLKWFYVLDNTWLLTHAGLHKSVVPVDILNKKDDRKLFINDLTLFLNESIKTGFKYVNNNESHWIFKAGFCRGGNQKNGGITWCDYRMEFNPFKGINQIFGHTPSDKNKIWYWTRINEAGNVVRPSYDDWQPTEEQLNNPNLSANISLDSRSNNTFAIWDGHDLQINVYKK